MMMIAFTQAAAVLDGRKTVTRRDWNEKHARRFKAGMIVNAYDKLPYRGGKCFAQIEILSIEREPLRQLRLNAAYGRAELAREASKWNTVDEFIAHNFAR